MHNNLKLLMFSLMCFFCYSNSAEAKQKICNKTECAQVEGTTHPYEKIKLERVIDGDTFKAKGRTVRLWGIDSPERGHPAYRVAGWFLESLIKNSDLKCRFLYKDKYQRDVMYCLADKQDVGSIMVRFGMATDFKKYSSGFYSLEESEARRNKIGIWSQ